MTAPSELVLALGPYPYHGSRASVLAMYEQVAHAPVETVYLGETVCAKRRALGPADWLALGRDLAAAGKEVVLSTLTLIEAGSELATVRRLCANGEFTVEANDMSAVMRVAEIGVPFVGGPALNVYSAGALAVLCRRGLYRWVPPVEMDREALRALTAEWPDAEDELPQTELFALGRMPLAWSARCFTARAHGRSKDDCGFVCAQYPGGMPLWTRDDQRFLTINGIQLQSGQPLNLMPYAQEIAALGIDRLRISPLGEDPLALLNAARALLDGAQPSDAVAAALGEPACDGYWHGRAGMSAASA